MKKFLFMLAIFFFMPINIFGEELDEQLNNFDFENVNTLINENASEQFDFKSLTKKIILGQFDFLCIFDFVRKIFFDEFEKNLFGIKNLLLLIILSGIIKNLSDSFKTKSVAQIAFYISYIVISSNLFSAFKILVGISKNFLQSLLQIMQASLPLIISLMTMSGNFYASSVFNPVIFLFADFIIMIINYMLPIVVMFVAVQIINNMTGKNLIANFAALIKNVIGWILKIVSFAFMSILSLQRISAPLLENITVKTAKFAINTVPVVGEVFTGALDSVMSWAHVIKNGAMIALVVSIFLVCMIPIIKLGIFILIYKILGAVVQPISDERIVKSTEAIADACVLLLSCCFTAVVIFLFAVMIFISV